VTASGAGVQEVVAACAAHLRAVLHCDGPRAVLGAQAERMLQLAGQAAAAGEQPIAGDTLRQLQDVQRSCAPALRFTGLGMADEERQQRILDVVAVQMLMHHHLIAATGGHPLGAGWIGDGGGRRRRC